MNTVKAIKKETDIIDLLNALYNYKQKYYIMLRLGVITGLRISDILRLRVRDVLNCIITKSDDNSITATFTITEKKTKKKREVILQQTDYKLLEDYCKVNQLKLDDFIIFSRPNKKNKALSRVQAWRILRREASKIGLNFVGTHSMRKTYAIAHFRKFKDILALQKILNHKYVTTTMQYILDISDINSINV